jgi:hypothetical protein
MRLADEFAALRDVPAEASFTTTRAWLARTADPRTPHATARPRWRRAVLGGMGLALAAACTVPVTHDETVAYVLSGRIMQPPAAARAALSALPWADPARLGLMGEVMVRMPSGKVELQALVASGKAVVNGRSVTTPSSQFAIVLPRARPEDVARWTREVQAVTGVVQAAAAPVQERVKRPALQAALVSMQIEVEPRQDERVVEARIQRHLEGLRMSGVTVTHVTRPDGTRGIRLSGPGMISGSPETGRRVNDVLNEVQER